jgi:hypothetical protein
MGKSDDSMNTAGMKRALGQSTRCNRVAERTIRQEETVTIREHLKELHKNAAAHHSFKEKHHRALATHYGKLAKIEKDARPERGAKS